MKKPMPSEAEVRRFFQQAYYTALEYDSDSHEIKVRYNDTTGMIYPIEDKNDRP